MEAVLQEKQVLMDQLEQDKVTEIVLVRAQEAQRADNAIAEKESELTRYILCCVPTYTVAPLSVSCSIQWPLCLCPALYSGPSVCVLLYTVAPLSVSCPIYLSSLQSSKTQYSTMPGNFGSPFAL